MQALKQDITSIENNLDDLSSQLELQAKENDKALQEQFQKLKIDLEDSMKRFEQKLDSLSQERK